MDAPVPVIVVALLAAATLVATGARARAAAMLGALAIAPVILLFHISGSEQLRALTDRPALAGAVAVSGVVVVAVLAAVFRRWPAALPVVAVAVVPFRIPIALGGSTANLLVPLYAVVAAGVLAFALPALFGGGDGDASRTAAGDGAARPRIGALEWALAGSLVLYAVQASYSADFDHALENVVFFYVPFALLFALVSRIAWTARLTAWCLGVLVVLALAFAGVGFVEYATRHLFLNPKVIASNQLQDYFRVNSLFFDPNIYGRFLALVMLLVVAGMLWTRRAVAVAGGVVVLAVLWGGLLLTLSQSSFTALLVGLAVLGGMRWSPRRAVALTAAVVLVGAAVVLLAPGAVRLDLGSPKAADAATSGRYALISGGGRLFSERPLQGWGAGSFAREFRRAEQVSAERATSASHTIPVTVAAEQGVVGLLAYVALLACALLRLLRAASSVPARAGIAAAFVALLAHTMLYAAFLEDPMTWMLLAVGTALAMGARRRARALVPPEAEPIARSRTPAAA